MLNEFVLDEDFGCIVNSAVRYSLGRYTYMPSTVVQFVRKYLNHLDNRTISVMIRDIDKALENEELPLREIWVGLKKDLEPKVDDNFGEVLMCAIRGAINMPGNAIDIVYSFIMDNLQFIDLTTLDHIKQYVWEWDTEVSNKLLEKIREIQKEAES